MKLWKPLRKEEVFSLVVYAIGGMSMLVARDFTVMLKLCCISDFLMLRVVHFGLFVALGAMVFSLIFWMDRRRIARKAAEDAAAF